MKNKENFFIDIHVLQTVPPSCINRDDTGSPKTAVYGGVIRARISSQAWKHVMRLMFSDILASDQIGRRTKGIVGMVADKIVAIDPNAAAEEMATTALENAGLSIKSAKSGTDALFFMSDAQAQALAELILNDEIDKEAYKYALKDNPSIDMALFGRMVASTPSLNYDAAAQVAHAISTHSITNEFDYFTAVDDLAGEDSSGAGHLGTTEYNSSTLYRYATVNVNELYSHLKEDTGIAVRTFIDTFIRSMPTGKQNSFANRTLPNLAYITIRKDQPVNLVGAFENPVVSGTHGYVATSVKRLFAHAENMYDSFVDSPAAAYIIGVNDGIDVPNAPAPVALKTALNEIENYLKDFYSDCEV